jgi:hypothetical protein
VRARRNRSARRRPLRSSVPVVQPWMSSGLSLWPRPLSAWSLRTEASLTVTEPRTLPAGQRPSEEDLEDSLRGAATLLEGTAERAEVQVRILDGGQRLTWRLTLKEGPCEVHREPVPRPNFEIIARDSTWWELAAGAWRRWTPSSGAGCASAGTSTSAGGSTGSWPGRRDGWTPADGRAALPTYSTVDWIKVGSTFCYVQATEEATGMSEVFHLWTDAEEASALERVTHSMHLSMLRDALVHGLKVDLDHLDDSAQVIWVEVFKERVT